MSTSADRPLGLITAIPDEFAALRDSFEEDRREDLAGFQFHVGRLAGTAVVAVEAGIGKVNAGVVATLLCHRFGVRALVFSGVAGGLDPGLDVGDVVIAERLVMHDYGALIDQVITPYQPGVPPLPGIDQTHGYAIDAGVAQAARSALEGYGVPPLSAQAAGHAQARPPRIAWGTVLTGDVFLNCVATRDRLHAQFGGQAIEMEGAAVAQVAERFGVPALVIRALSDRAGEGSDMDFSAFLAETARIAAGIVRRVIPAL